MASVEKRKEGVFRITVSRKDPSTGENVKHRKNVYTNSQREAEREASKFEADIDRNLILTSSTNYKFVELAQKWVNEYARENLAPKTVDSYIREINTKILPYIGGARVDTFSPLDALRFTNKLKSHKKVNSSEIISKTTQIYAWKITHKIFSDAVKWQMIPYNPLDRVERIKNSKKNKKTAPYYNVEQLELLFKAMDTTIDFNYKWCIGVYIIAFSGIRSGEAEALEWEDVDFDNKVIEISKSKQYISGIGVIEKGPKNESSNRYISIGDILIRKLSEYKKFINHWEKTFAFEWKGSKKIICNIDGSEVFPGSLSKWFGKFVKANNLDHMTIHGLRHTHTTLLMYSGENEKAICDRMGWSSNEMLRTYAHRLNFKDKSISNRFDEIILTNKKGEGKNG